MSTNPQPYLISRFTAWRRDHIDPLAPFLFISPHSIPALPYFLVFTYSPPPPPPPPPAPSLFHRAVKLSAPVEIFSWTLHMHTIGYRGRTEHWRDGVKLGVVGCMGYASSEGVAADGVDGCYTDHGDQYRFDYQAAIPIPDASRRVTLQPGDEMRTVSPPAAAAAPPRPGPLHLAHLL